jgi:Carbohydrate esterase, sialic acid-specific acetylesterase
MARSGRSSSGQGGSDAKNQEDAHSWKDRFTAFVAELRADLGNPDLPIIMVMLGDPDEKVAKKYPYWQAVRAQQHAVNIPGVTKIEANGYERKADGIHFTTKGQLAFGAALAGLLPAP